MNRPVSFVDVFTDTPYRGNPVAVIGGADGVDGLDEATMLRVANWTNLSETTFVLPPTRPEADYRVRIFTPAAELPFAGHPTLGTCHAWLAAGGTPRDGSMIVQECAAGLVRVARSEGRLAFAAPPRVRSGPVEPELLARVTEALGNPPVQAAEWVDNGPGWLAVLLPDAADVLALRPRFIDQDIGVVGPYPPDGAGPAAFEVRAFFPVGGELREDPVTGSLNASVAQWLLATGRATAPYVASQGTALGRAGRVHISQDADGTVWVGGDTVECITGGIDI